MSEWNVMTYEGKDTALRVIRNEADGFMDLAARPDTWEGPTACSDWQVRDIVGHLVDTTESYFERFDAARSRTDVGPPYPLTGMWQRAGEQGRSFREVPQPEMLERLSTDLDKMLGIFDGLNEQDWTDLIVPHFYMGPLPAFFYPAFQVVDYGVHSWDMRDGTGRGHALDSDAADLLVPVMFVLWQATAKPTDDRADIGVRVTSGPNAGDTLVHVGPDGMSYEQSDLSGVGTVVEFDPGSLVLTAFGRCNAGTVRGDRATAERFLNLFFRI